jgi:hypothetical protein
MAKIRGVRQQNVVHFFGGQEAVLLQTEGQVLSDRDQIPIQQLGGFVLTDGAIAHCKLQKGVGHRIDGGWGTVPELSYDEFLGLFHDRYLKLGLVPDCRISVLGSSSSFSLGW